MKSFSLGVLASLAAVAAPALRADLSLTDALTRASAQHPRLRAAEARAQAAGDLIEQAGYVPNPTLGVTFENFAGTGPNRGVDVLESTVELSQKLERGRKRASRTALATRDQAIVLEESAAIRATLLGVVAHDYVVTQGNAGRLALARDLATLAQQTLTDAEARQRAGDASATEPARARSAVAIAQAEVVRRETALAASRAVLAAHWGGSVTDVTLDASSLRLPEAAPASTLLLTRLEQHPRIRVEEARLAGRRAALELEQANAKPDLEVAGGIRYFRENSDAALVAGLSVPLPTRHRNQAAIRAARSTLAGAEFEVSATLRDLQLEFSAAWQELAASHSAAAQLRQHAMPASASSLELVRRAYAQGQASWFEVLEAERTHAALRRDLLDQEIAYALAVARVDALTDPSFTATRQLFAAAP